MQGRKEILIEKLLFLEYMITDALGISVRLRTTDVLGLVSFGDE